MPRSGGPPETEFQILDGETQTCHWPPLLRALSAHAHTRATPPGPHPPVPDPLARRDWRIRGFYFAPAGEVPDRLGTPVRCWRRRAHALPEEPGIPDPDDPYARLPDGRKADVGILYLGANPLAHRHWLIWVAGLGSVGTVGAAIALQNPRVVEAMARGLTGPHHYCCALVRYRVADEQRPSTGPWRAWR